nr:6-phosphogluconate dehydrogenase, decarboxylating 3 [Tanacetum cinerariifolium]
MNLIRAKSVEKDWGLKLGELARIWKGGCIIRAIFLDRIKQAYDRNPELANLLVDPEFAKEMVERQSAWRRVVCLSINAGISTPGMSTSLAYFDTYRRERLPANLVQAQRDYFGAHTYERTDMPGSFHTECIYASPNMPNRGENDSFEALKMKRREHSFFLRAQTINKIANTFVIENPGKRETPPFENEIPDATRPRTPTHHIV